MGFITQSNPREDDETILEYNQLQGMRYYGFRPDLPSNEQPSFTSSDSSAKPKSTAGTVLKIVLIIGAVMLILPLLPFLFCAVVLLLSALTSGFT